MHKLDINRTGMAVGSFVAVVHIVWVLLASMGKVASGIKFILGVHFLSVPFTMLNFSWKGGVMLVVLTGIVGYVAGSLFACIWNRVGTK